MKKRLLKLTIVIIIILYLGLTVLNAGIFNPVEWKESSKHYFIWITFASVLMYGIFTAEPPKNNQ